MQKKAAQKSAKHEAAGQARRVIPEFSATGIDDALDLLSIDEGSVKAKDIEKHPERRFKAALAAYEERELPRIKAENPGLRLTQLKELVYKAFQKAPENPFNQANVLAYNATQDEAQAMKGNKLTDRLCVNVLMQSTSQQEQEYREPPSYQLNDLIYSSTCRGFDFCIYLSLKSIKTMVPFFYYFANKYK